MRTKEFSKGMIKKSKLTSLLSQHIVDGGGKGKRRASSARFLDCVALHPMSFVHITFR